MEGNKIKKIHRDIIYSLPAFSFAIPTFPVMIFLPALYTEKYQISLVSIGVIIFCAKIIDIISDPMMGWLNDISIFKRKTWMIIGGLISGLSMYYLFLPVTKPNEIYLGIFITLLYLGWTIFQVPFLSLGYDLEQNYYLRTRLSATREFFILMGLTASVSLPVLLNLGDSEVFITYLAIITGVCTLTLFLFLIGEPIKKKIAKRPKMNSLLKDRNFLRLIMAWLINCLSNVFPTVLFVFFVTYVIGGSEESRDKILLFYFLSAFIGMPLWVQISKYIEKKNVWLVSMFSSALFFFFVFFLGEGDINFFIIISILTGICLGADLSIPPSIQSDLVDNHKSNFGEDISGLFFSSLTLINKLAFGIASIVSFSLLDAYEFQAGDNADNEAKLLLYFLYAGLPILLKLFACYLVWKFSFTQKNAEDITKKLYG